ncbi:hypothetical protein CLU79DRAFT_757443 [Phycomyces nitens]|nr:hypothetical protein CLU79DRAFT_757443 [Phycomyces nitens]
MQPTSDFILYCSERQENLRMNNPNITKAQINKILVDEWNNMPQAFKEDYKQRAKNSWEQPLKVNETMPDGRMYNQRLPYHTKPLADLTTQHLGQMSKMPSTYRSSQLTVSPYSDNASLNASLDPPLSGTAVDHDSGSNDNLGQHDETHYGSVTDRISKNIDAFYTMSKDPPKWYSSSPSPPSTSLQRSIEAKYNTSTSTPTHSNNNDNSASRLSVSAVTDSSFSIPSFSESSPQLSHHSNISEEKTPPASMRGRNLLNLISHPASEADPMIANDDLQPANKSNKAQQKSYRKYNEEPERLKRPPNAYLLFNRYMRSRLLKVNPNLSVAEISKTVSAQWKELSEKDRKPYNQEASQLKQEHMDMHPNFVYTRRSKAELEKAGHRTRPSQKRKEMLKSEVLGQGEASTSKTTPPLKVRDPRGRKKKRLTHPTAPKHPMSGFLFFAGSVRQKIALQRPSASVGDVSKIIAGKWRELTDAERNPWCLRATEDKGRYAREMQEFMAASKVKSSTVPEQPKNHNNLRNVIRSTSPAELDSRTIATVAQMVNPTDRRDFLPVSEQAMDAYQFQVPATPPSPNVDSHEYSNRNNE